MPPLLRTLRPHQWSKNLILVVPSILGQVWDDPGVATQVLVAVMAFSLAASGGYVINDLLDLEADRAHPQKRHRPFASGEISRLWGLVLGPLLVLAGAALGFAAVNAALGKLVVLYVIVAVCYSAFLKQKLLLDVIVLAGLYTLRLLAGGAAAGVEVSGWLLGFAMFFFLSLAFVKRLTEITSNTTGAAAGAESGRAYRPEDLDAFRSIGPAAGLLSILVLALYVSSDAVRQFYPHARELWLVCPLLLYWILRVWFLALRGELPYDPVIFAIRDRVSYIVVGAIGVILYVASMNESIF